MRKILLTILLMLGTFHTYAADWNPRKGDIVFNPKDAVIQGNIRYYKNRNFIGRWLDAMGTVNWPYAVLPKGRYELYIKYTAGYSAYSQGGEVEISAANKNFIYEVYGTGSWRRLKVIKAGTINVTKTDVHPLQIKTLLKNKKALWDIHSIVFRNTSPDFSPERQAEILRKYGSKEQIRQLLTRREINQIKDRSLRKFARQVHLKSGGRYGGGTADLKIGDKTIFNDIPFSWVAAGIYVAAVYEGKLILREHYNTLTAQGASYAFAKDMAKLPEGSLVAVMVHTGASRYFDLDGQKALISIGARKGLLKQPRYSSYYCIGRKGLRSGEALEKISKSALLFDPGEAKNQLSISMPEVQAKPSPKIDLTPGFHEGLFVDGVEVFYYVPRSFNKKTVRYLVGIHGAGDYHRIGASAYPRRYWRQADKNNVIIISPCFDAKFNWPVGNTRREQKKRLNFKTGKFYNRKIVRDWFMWDYVMLINKHSRQRSDKVLIKIFNLFKKQVANRKRFSLMGHSGGAQFSSRFFTLYPHLIDRIAISAGGSYPFPTFQYKWGLGLDTSKLQRTFGPHIKVEDIQSITIKGWEKRLNALLDHELYIYCGDRDLGGTPIAMMQGRHRYERAINYYKALKALDKRLKREGKRSRRKPFLVKLHILRGVPHDGATFIKRASKFMFDIQ